MKNRKYEYQTTILSLDGTTQEDYSVLLEVVSFTSQRALGAKADSDADCYGYTSIEWHTNDDINFMTDDDVQVMEEWLSIEHEGYLKDEAYYDVD